MGVGRREPYGHACLADDVSARQLKSWIVCIVVVKAQSALETVITIQVLAQRINQKHLTLTSL